MGHRFWKYIAALCGAASILASCSTAAIVRTKDKYYLAENVVKFTVPTDLKVSDISPYFKQQAPSMRILPKNWIEFNRGLVDASVDSIIEHLKYMGYHNSKVETRIVARNHWVSVYYTITPGQRYRISEIRFKVPQGSVFEADFLDDIDNVTIKVGDYLAEADLEAETVRSAAHMRTKGYFNFDKNFYSFEADTLAGPDSTILEMRVEEYQRNQNPNTARPHEIFTIGKVDFSYPADLPFNNDIIKSLNTIQPGKIYNEEDINTTYSRLSALKVFSGVAIELSEAEGNKVNCNVSLTPSKLQGFKVNWESSSNSSGLIGISPQLTYYNKNIFHGGEWLNLGFMGNFQRKFNVSGVHSEEFGVSASLSLPRFVGIPVEFFKGPNVPRTEINASYDYQSRPEYFRHLISTSFGYTGLWGRRLSYQLYPLQLNMVRLVNIDPAFLEKIHTNPFMWYSYQNHFDAGIGGTLYYSSSNELVPKTSYHYHRLSVDMSGNILSLFKGIMRKDANNAGLVLGSPFSQYVRAEYTLGRTWRFGAQSRLALATRALAGIGFAYGNSSSLPFEKQFYSGGANSLRGWRSRSVGPGSSALNDFFIIPSQTGDVKLEANMEFRFPIFWKVEGALFAEAGNVWSMKSDNQADRMGLDFYKELAADWGTGVRVDLNFIVLRLDAGFRVHDPARALGEQWVGPSGWFASDGMAFHFGVGYPF